MKKLKEEMEQLTKQLVCIPSVNTTSGEKDIALYIENYLRSIPYFINNPDQIIIQELKNDPFNRRNVFAYIKGIKENNGDTILLHGHMDTVGVEDYGALEKICFQPEELLGEMLKMKELPESVRKDLETGDWMVGRGSCDMKSGVAVFLVLLKELSERAKELSGNILLSVNPVEENLHTGIIEGTKVLHQLHENEGFRYVLAINNDYICPLYEGDPKKYIYTGAVGKLLPCFYIKGKETHVGQCFEGFDASMIAAQLVRDINLNTDFCDSYEGEYTLPPSVLKMKDLKSWYNVQTASDAFVYFNFFVHHASMQEIIAKLKDTCEAALDKVLNKLNEEYLSYCKLSKDEYKRIEIKKTFLTYDELYKEAVEKLGVTVATELNIRAKKMLEEKVDKREIPMNLVKYLLQELQIKDPVIVLFFAAPYCPHNTLKSENIKEKQLIHRLYRIVDEFQEELEDKEKEEYKILQFFPSLSDSSYLKIDDEEASIQQLIDNFPEYDTLYSVPLKSIKKLNIPAVNYGCYGKDAHKWTERVYKPYTFSTLPKLIIKTIEDILV